MRRFLRYLRIAFSATCLVACVLLIVLWVRSYWWWDTISWGITSKQGLQASSQSGGTVFQYIDMRGFTLDLYKWRLHSQQSPDANPMPISGMDEAFAGFLFLNGMVAIPYWFLVPVSAVCAAVPWIRWRFTLRTLLIATTLVALVLGVIVYAAR
jgi:hypothetical protein